MKALMPWVCLLATTSVQVAFATNGIDAYREGNYAQAAPALINLSGKDPIVEYYLGKMRLYGYGLLKNNTQALRHFQQAGEKGFLPAQTLMARYSLLQQGNVEQALYWFKKAADANDSEAQMYCAAAYLFGVGTKKNPDTAKRYYIAAAKNGNSIAQYTLATDFINSKNAGNKKLGLLWLSKSATLGNPQAQLELGRQFALGTVVPRDLNKAHELINLAVAQGYLPALIQLGDMAKQDNNLQLAHDWYKKGADASYAPAQMALAQLYLQPTTTFYNPHTGYLLMLKPAQNGYGPAQLALATLYKEGKVLTKDDHLASEWQQKSVESAKETPVLVQLKAAKWLSNDKFSTFAVSNYQLGGIFNAWANQAALKQNQYNQAPQMEEITRETLYKPDFNMADPNKIAINEYFDALVDAEGNLKPAEMNFPAYPIDSQYTQEEKVASLNVDGKPQKIIEPLHNQAILGDPGAQFTLGKMYQEGISVEKNIQEAINYFQMAAAQKDLPSQYTLGMIYLNGHDLAPDYQQALANLRAAAFKGDAYAQYALALIYEHGYHDASGKEVIPADPEQAISMCYLAADNNYGPAQFRLAEILVREKPADISIAAQEKHTQLIRQLYQRAVAQGVEAAALPLAFFNAMSPDKAKQTLAFTTAKNEASKGNGQAALLLGLMYDRGISVPADQGEALKWYQKATLNPVSAYILGTYYSQGKGVSKDAAKGLALLQQAANGKFSYANLNLAIIKQQQGEAFVPELETALSLGNSMAGLLLADYSLSLANNDEQMKKARDIYQHFAEKGDKDAQLKLAFMLERGLGGEIDLANAQRWYGVAAAQGQVVAQYLLGHLYQLGWLNNQPDYPEAKKWYSSAQSNYAPAAVALGFIYDTVDDDYAHAAAEYQLAANQQDVAGIFNLGLIYEYGKGCPVDFAKALALYKQAAAKGHSQAMVQLANLYFDGFSGSRDESQALYWYKKAADAGEREALYKLGLFSETGVASKLDFTAALHYYQQAVDKGDAQAMIALARMYRYGIGVKADPQQVEKFYHDLAALNNPYAQYQLAQLEMSNNAGKPLSEQAKWLLQQAAQNGSLLARKALQSLDNQKQIQSFIEPVLINQFPIPSKQSAELMYLEALNQWNSGNEAYARIIFTEIIAKFPQFKPAKHAYAQLQQK